MRMPNGVVGVIAGACCAAVIACASARSPASRPATTGAEPFGGHGEIERLDAEIAASRDKLGLQAPAPVMAGSAPRPTPMTSGTDPACHPAKTDTCSDTCTLADSICSDAAKICELAKQLPGDTWAEGKCTSGQASCDAAHGRCCGCE